VWRPFKLERTPFVFVQPISVLVLWQGQLQLRLDVDGLRPSGLESLLFLLEWRHFQIETTQFVNSRGLQRPRTGTGRPSRDRRPSCTDAIRARTDTVRTGIDEIRICTDYIRARGCFKRKAIRLGCVRSVDRRRYGIARHGRASGGIFGREWDDGEWHHRRRWCGGGSGKTRRRLG
jgi:hypothetical protein